MEYDMEIEIVMMPGLHHGFWWLYLRFLGRIGEYTYVV